MSRAGPCLFELHTKSISEALIAEAVALSNVSAKKTIYENF